MKLAIIYGDISTTHQLMIERAEEIFDSVLAAPVDGIRFFHGEEGDSLMYKNTDLTEFDAVYVRTNVEDHLFSEHIVEVLNESGVVTQAENDSFSYSNNKFYSMKILSENSINVPESVYTISPDSAVKAADEIGYPVIMKTIGGSGGEGVMRAQSENELKPVMDTMKSLEQEICIQDYQEHGGEDWRAIIIGDNVYAYRRSSEGDEWRSNISGGGSRKEAELSDEMEEMALKAARASGFDICGCDIIECDGENFILEINSAFGFNEDINEIIGEDIILKIVEHLHEKALERR